MTPERANELLDQEEERLRGLRTAEREGLSESLEDSTGELSSFDQHPADVATETHERELEQSFAQSTEQALRDVADARERLAAGEYGRCKICGAEIGDERLEAVPTARYCVTHQAEVEQGSATPET